MSQRSVLAVGSFDDDAMQAIRDAAVAAGVTPEFHGRSEDAREPLGTANPLAIVLRMSAPGAESFCAHVRTQARLFDVPIFGVTAEKSDIGFTELFSWGGDDLVSLETSQPLTRRLRPLIGRAPQPRSEGQGAAVVAGVDPRWRSIMGRGLYAGGFSVRFVGSATELSPEALGAEVRIVVVADDISEEGAAACAARARTAGSETAWVVVVPPKRIAASISAVRAVSKVAIADGYAPPENVLFLANELLARRGVDQRSSARLLYGTTVAFRIAGRDQDEIGFSYNISAAGLYVRTLAPLDQGQDVWLEMWAPRSERHVRLAGSVAWKRPFGSGERATVPAGFGVKLTDGLAGDFDRWREGYRLFAESILGTPGTPSYSPKA